MNPRITFGRFITQYWIPTLKKEQSPITARQYKNIIIRHGKPLEPRQIRTITTTDMRDFFTPIWNSGLSPNSLHAIECAFSSVFRLATERGAIPQNPMDTLRQRHRGALPFTPYTDDQLSRIEACLPYYPGTNIFGAAMHSDLKRYQLLGISAEDFPADIQRNKVRVTHIVLESDEFDVASVQPNPWGDEELPVSNKALAYLEDEYRSLQSKATRPEFRNANDLLFVNRTGGSISLQELGRSSRAIRQMSGVPDFCLKNLRRTYRLRREHSEVL